MAFIRYLLLAAAIPAATTAESVEHIQDHAQKHQSTALPKHSSMSEVLHSFTLIDANADGMLSREELSQSIATLQLAKLYDLSGATLDPMVCK